MNTMDLVRFFVRVRLLLAVVVLAVTMPCQDHVHVHVRSAAALKLQLRRLSTIQKMHGYSASAQVAPEENEDPSAAPIPGVTDKEERVQLALDLIADSLSAQPATDMEANKALAAILRTAKSALTRTETSRDLVLQTRPLDAIVAQLGDNDVFIRETALRAMQKLSTDVLDSKVDVIVAMLESGNYDVREAALRAMQNLSTGVLDSKVDVIVAMLEDSDYLVRKYALATMQKLSSGVLDSKVAVL